MSGRSRGAAAVLAVLVGALTLAGTSGGAPAAAAPGPPDAPQYYLDQWDATGLWAAGARGQGVVIAELDTGVAAALPELDQSVLTGADFGPGPAGSGDGRTDRDTDQFGHGTAMASLMVAAPGTFGITGLAPDAQVLPVALPLVGTADATADDQLPQAIRYAADHGAGVISMSLGEKRSPTADTRPCPDDLQAAVFHAMDRGAVLIAASGNQGDAGSPVVSPGVCLGVVSVGAVDRTGAVAGFSSRHPYLTLTAPGVHVPSLSRVRGRAYSGDGTSQATALTAAAFAVVRSAHPELTPAQLVARVLATLTPPPGHAAGTHDDAYGYGTLRLDAAVRQDVPADAPDPVYAAAAPFRAQAGAPAPVAPHPPSPAPDPPSGAVALPAGRPPARVDATVLLGAAVALVGLVLSVAALRRGGRPATVPDREPPARPDAPGPGDLPAAPSTAPPVAPSPAWAPPPVAGPRPPDPSRPPGPNGPTSQEAPR